MANQILRTTLLVTVVSVAGLGSETAHAQSGGHYHYHPGHYDYHRGHYHWHPGHYDFHSTGNYWNGNGYYNYPQIGNYLPQYNYAVPPANYVPQTTAPLPQNTLVSPPNQLQTSFDGRPIVISNPKDAPAPIGYVLNGYTFTMKPGETQQFLNDRAWTIQFTRGVPGSADLRYSLSAGRYAFLPSSKGWDLVTQNESPVAPIPEPPAPSVRVP